MLIVRKVVLKHSGHPIFHTAGPVLTSNVLESTRYHELSTCQNFGPSTSTSAGLLSIDTSHFGFDRKRRDSLNSSSLSQNTDTLTTPAGSIESPLTPINLKNEMTFPLNAFSSGLHLENVGQDQHSFVKGDNFSDEDFWIIPKERNTPFDIKSEFGYLPSSNSSQGLLPFPNGTTNTSFTNVSFWDQVMNGPNSELDESTWSWQSTSPYTGPETIAPYVTFRRPLPSSPVTPIGGFESAFAYESSPISAVAEPYIVPSQRDMEDVSCSGFDLIHSPVKLEASTPTRNAGRLAKRQYHRKNVLDSSDEPCTMLKKSGLLCEFVRQNTFPCSFPGCKDKNGRPRRFKRQEHQKRHVKTVHQKKEHPVFPCWVPKCQERNRAFTRKDNLNSHLKNTHGKKSDSKRNCYVATLDKDSEYHDPEWQGQLNEDGEPTGPGLFPCWVSKCRERNRAFTCEQNLTLHFAKTHGKRSATRRNCYVATLDEGSEFYDPEWQGEFNEDGEPLGHPKFPFVKAEKDIKHEF